MNNMVEGQILWNLRSFSLENTYSLISQNFPVLGDLFDHFLLEYCLQNKKSLISPIIAVRSFFENLFFQSVTMRLKYAILPFLIIIC